MTTRDAQLRDGTTAHYADAAYYVHAYRRRRKDVAFYVERARDVRGGVLELGVGTGRVATAIARAGVSVTGVDSMAPMLERAQQHVDRLPAAARARVTLRRGDLRSVRLREAFALVIAPFNVFMHLYTRRDVERALATVHAHLRPRGRLIFDVLNPDPAMLARRPDRPYRCRPIRRPGDGKRYGYQEAFEYDAVSQVQTIHMLFEDPESPGFADHQPLAHRQFFPAELEALLHYNGFRIEERLGDFEGSPFRGDSDSQVMVARPVRGRG